MLSLLRAFVTTRGWSELRRETVVPPGVRLLNWVHKRRQDYRNDRIADWLVSECEAIPGWTWYPHHDRHLRNIDHLRGLVRKRGWEGLTKKTLVDGVNLTTWVTTRRGEYDRGELASWLAKALAAIPGWSWDPLTSHYTRNLRALRGHVARHGWSDFGLSTRSRDGVAIGRWVNHVRGQHRRGKVPQWLASALESLSGWTWEPLITRQERKLRLLREFVAKHGWEAARGSFHFRGERLGQWIAYCRNSYALGRLSPITTAGLAAIPGWRW